MHKQYNFSHNKIAVRARKAMSTHRFSKFCFHVDFSLADLI